MEDNCAVARKWFDLYSRKDIEGCLELMAEDVCFEPPREAEKQVFIGRDQVRAYFDRAPRQLGRPLSTVVVTEVRALDERRTITHGHAVEPEIDFITLHEFDDEGLIASSVSFYGSDEGLLRSVGRI